MFTLLTRHVFTLLTIVPAFAIALATRHVDTLVSFTGAFAGMFIQFVIPAALVYQARRDQRVLRLLAEEEAEAEAEEEEEEEGSDGEKRVLLSRAELTVSCSGGGGGGGREESGSVNRSRSGGMRSVASDEALHCPGRSSGQVEAKEKDLPVVVPVVAERAVRDTVQGDNRLPYHHLDVNGAHNTGYSLLAQPLGQTNDTVTIDGETVERRAARASMRQCIVAKRHVVHRHPHLSPFRHVCWIYLIAVWSVFTFCMTVYNQIHKWAT